MLLACRKIRSSLLTAGVVSGSAKESDTCSAAVRRRPPRTAVFATVAEMVLEVERAVFRATGYGFHGRTCSRYTPVVAGSTTPCSRCAWRGPSRAGFDTRRQSRTDMPKRSPRLLLPYAQAVTANFPAPCLAAPNCPALGAEIQVLDIHFHSRRSQWDSSSWISRRHRFCPKGYFVHIWYLARISIRNTANMHMV